MKASWLLRAVNSSMSESYHAPPDTQLIHDLLGHRSIQQFALRLSTNRRNALRFQQSSHGLVTVGALTRSCERNSIATSSRQPRRKKAAVVSRGARRRLCLSEILPAGRHGGLTAAAPEFSQHEPAQSAPVNQRRRSS